jgi:hypothetical protein
MISIYFQQDGLSSFSRENPYSLDKGYLHIYTYGPFFC